MNGELIYEGEWKEGKRFVEQHTNTHTNQQQQQQTTFCFNLFQNVKLNVFLVMDMDEGTLKMEYTREAGKTDFLMVKVLLNSFFLN
jgi:hypothetical protein